MFSAFQLVGSTVSKQWGLFEEANCSTAVGEQGFRLLKSNPELQTPDLCLMNSNSNECLMNRQNRSLSIRHLTLTSATLRTSLTFLPVFSCFDYMLLQIVTPLQNLCIHFMSAETSRSKSTCLGAPSAAT